VSSTVTFGLELYCSKICYIRLDKLGVAITVRLKVQIEYKELLYELGLGIIISRAIITTPVTIVDKRSTKRHFEEKLGFFSTNYGYSYVRDWILLSISLS
jgi:hypothetical protein